MDRYSEVTNKNQREIVLLKAFPCVWGKCSFCDYILDNSTNEDEINKLNFEVLENITGNPVNQEEETRSVLTCELSLYRPTKSM